MPATKKLIAGYQRFRKGYFQEHKDLFSALAEKGQAPRIALVSCCDSRVEPAVILDCEPGDLFVIRNVANLVPPCEHDDNFHGTSAALEYAVNSLEVQSIVVLGHTQCGGIKALMDRTQPDAEKSFIATWMKQLDDVRSAILNDDSYSSNEQRYHACEQQGIARSLRNLMTFPWIRERVESGKLRIHGWYYDLNNAELFALDHNSGSFRKIS